MNFQANTGSFILLVVLTVPGFRIADLWFMRWVVFQLRVFWGSFLIIRVPYYIILGIRNRDPNLEYPDSWVGRLFDVTC